MASLRSKGIRLLVKLFVSRLLSTKITPQVQRKRFEKASFPLWRSFKFASEAVDIEGIPAELVVAEGASKKRVILYLHGGAYTFGSPRTHTDLSSGLSHFAKMSVLIVDYRLAPEHPYPAALDDSTKAYKWLLKQDYKPENIIIAGDSAGGGLTLATMLKLRDQGETLPAAGVCLSPWVDLCCQADSYTKLDKLDPLLSTNWLQEMAKFYIQDEDPRTPYISPLYGDFKGLPPIMIQVGSDEVLLDDSIKLEKRLREDGVEVELKIYQDMWHVWQLFSAILPEGKEALVEISEFVNAKITATAS